MPQRVGWQFIGHIVRTTRRPGVVVMVMGLLSPLRRPRDVRDPCLDRVWQDAEVHGALLRIRWATGRQQTADS